MKKGVPLPDGLHIGAFFDHPSSIIKGVLERFRRVCGEDIFQKTVFELLEYNLGREALYKACGEYRRQTKPGNRERNDDRALVEMGRLLAQGLATNPTAAARLVLVDAKDEHSTVAGAARLARKFKEREAVYRCLGETQYCEARFLDLTGYQLWYILTHDRTPLDQLHHDDPMKAEEAEAILRRHEAAWYRPAGASWPQLPQKIVSPGKRRRGRPRKPVE